MPEPSNPLPWEEAKSHAELYMERERATTPEERQRLSGPEHRAFAREAIAENPLLAVPIAAAIPLHQARKIVAGGLRENGSQPSVTQMVEGYKGVGEGVAAAVSAPWEEAKKEAKNFADKFVQAVPESVKGLFPWQEAAKTAEKATGVPPPQPIVLKAPEPSKGIPTEKDMKVAAMFTPAEIAARDVQMTSDSFLSEMKAEIDSMKDPARKKILQADYDTLVKRKKK